MTDLSRLPRVDAVVDDDELASWIRHRGRHVVTRAVQSALEDARTLALAGGDVPDQSVIVAAVTGHLTGRDTAGLSPVINATGVLLHTNLGRAPLSIEATAAASSAAQASSLEFDMATGRRGSRTAHVGALVTELFATEDATVVNNGAAALMLTLSALAADGHTIISRGEQIEIGGSYRLPDVITATGTTMVEVGTTNRTHPRDYDRAAAANPGAVLLKVHPSNYAVEGFTAGTTVADLRVVADAHDAVLVVDLGSGLLTDHDGLFADEPSVEAALQGGADLVLCSGDKLLGGPQAGIIAGRADLVERCRRHPLARAVRIDKLQRAALEATLAAHLKDPGGLTTLLPLGTMLALSAPDLVRRAEALAAHFDDEVRVATMDSVVGGGTLPGRLLPSVGVVLDDPGGSVTAGLRAHGVIARLQHDTCHLDLRTVLDGDDDTVLKALQAVTGHVPVTPQATNS